MTSSVDTAATTIGVFGHYGNGNLGDEAIITAVIQNIRQHVPQATVYGFSVNPEDTTNRYHIPAFPIRHSAGTNRRQAQHDEAPMAHPDPQRGGAAWKRAVKKITPLYMTLKAGRYVWEKGIGAVAEVGFLSRSYRVLKTVDLLLMTGSNQFLDNFGGPWGFPYTLLKWSILARLAGSKLCFVSVGAGPLSSRLSKMLIKWALLCADYTSLRDEASKRLIESTGFQGKCFVYPDLAHSLCIETSLSSQSEQRRETDQPTIGINPMPLYDSRYWFIDDTEKYTNYVRKLAVLSSRLLQEGYPLFFFNTQPKDEDVIRDIVALLDEHVVSAAQRQTLLRSSRSVADLMSQIASADMIIATRFHGTLLPLLATKPVLAICYHRKTNDLMKAMGQEAYSVGCEDFDVEDMINRFKGLEANRKIEISKIKTIEEEYKNLLQKQYNCIFSFCNKNA